MFRWSLNVEFLIYDVRTYRTACTHVRNTRQEPHQQQQQQKFKEAVMHAKKTIYKTLRREHFHQKLFRNRFTKTIWNRNKTIGATVKLFIMLKSVLDTRCILGLCALHFVHSHADCSCWFSSNTSPSPSHYPLKWDYSFLPVSISWKWNVHVFERCVTWFPWIWITFIPFEI